jgi:hypothetical protein
MHELKHVERTCGCAQVLVGEVQIDRGLFEITMAKQDLDRAQIGSGFEQMRLLQTLASSFAAEFEGVSTSRI